MGASPWGVFCSPFPWLVPTSLRTLRRCPTLCGPWMDRAILIPISCVPFLRHQGRHRRFDSSDGSWSFWNSYLRNPLKVQIDPIAFVFYIHTIALDSLTLLNCVADHYFQS
ncbi:hypothetical protein M404DRAFT_1000166 [Pisolithus tinctorius Marx 270]|uniref:Uncharacterized protein n=1 Tax=Pisolithus tinctorius Marx 270 TaxID=870435 RepID=A0A0C3PB20_PISTI|nr:hypothetical protein M404DRAFT_1000166 [Pisolithus tinctorius Marx 270]